MCNTRPLSGWLLLTDFPPMRYSGSDQSLLAEALAAVKGVNLRAQQLERINQAFGRAIARAAGGEGLATPLPLRVRIWRLGSCTDECGWGFFLVEKQGSESATGAEHLIELFLYQELES